MKVNKKVTINLTENEIKKIVAAHLTKQGYAVKDGNIHFSLSIKEDGDDMFGRRYQSAHFDGCEIDCKEMSSVEEKKIEDMER